MSSILYSELALFEANRFVTLIEELWPKYNLECLYLFTIQRASGITIKVNMVTDWQVINHRSTGDSTNEKHLRQRDSIWNTR